MKRIALAGFLGALAMFVWMSIAHMLLPLDETGVQSIANEDPFLAHMTVALPGPGLYMFPNMAPNMDQAAYYRKIASGPSGMLIYMPKRDFSFGATLVVEFVTELAETLIAVWLLSVTSLRTFAARFGFFAALGLLAAIATNVSYWNWYAFPASYTIAVMLTAWVGFLAAGAVAAFMKIGA
jgi:hypothetical protein